MHTCDQPRFMLSLGEKDKSETLNQAHRNRDPEAVVRLPYDGSGVQSAGAGVLPIPEIPFRGWDEMVFENRNKAYGAYVLRKVYSHNLTIGLVLTLILVTGLILYPTLSGFFGQDAVASKDLPRKLVYTELSAPPSIDRPKPIPPNVRLPRLQKVVKFVPPKVVKETVTEEVPAIEEIKASATGAEAVEGPAQVVFNEPVEEAVVEEDEIFIAVDQLPEFKGGYEAMMAFIKQNMQYPPNARRMKIEGTVHVSFVVSKTGEISEVKVLRGIMTECDREAIRVVQLMPPWNPGKQNGRTVSVRFILPLKFRLS